MKKISLSFSKSLLGRCLPVLGMSVLAIALWMILGALKEGHYDPRAIGAPSQLHPIPNFKAEPLSQTLPSFDSEALKQAQKPVLVVFFSSWCVSCISEMPALKELQKTISLWGVDYDDKISKGRAFIEKSQIAFERLDADQDGLIGANWGLTGVPESFLIMPGGKIAFHAAGPIDIQDFQTHILPLIQDADALPSATMMTKKAVPFPAS